MLTIFTGNGKGKTSAALGQALRFVGDGGRVLMIQFIKGPWKSGEDASSKRLHPDFMIVKAGRGFVGIMGDTLPRRDHEDAARIALAYAKREIDSGDWEMVILDEVNNAVSLGLIAKEKVLRLIKYSRRRLKHLVLTGR